ncbi:MAG: hypothetical protein ACK40G_16070 [Cytophagaceae bacterium]
MVKSGITFWVLISLLWLGACNNKKTDPAPSNNQNNQDTTNTIPSRWASINFDGNLYTVRHKENGYSNYCINSDYMNGCTDDAVTVMMAGMFDKGFQSHAPGTFSLTFYKNYTKDPSASSQIYHQRDELNSIFKTGTYTFSSTCGMETYSTIAWIDMDGKTWTTMFAGLFTNTSNDYVKINKVSNIPTIQGRLIIEGEYSCYLHNGSMVKPVSGQFVTSIQWK